MGNCCCFGSGSSSPKSSQENLPPPVAAPPQQLAKANLPRKKGKKKKKKKKKKPEPDAFDAWHDVVENKSGPQHLMGQVHKNTKLFLRQIVDLKKQWRKDFHPDYLLIFEGATFTLAECDEKLGMFPSKDPYKFLGAILVSAAGYSLSYFFMDLLPGDVQMRLVNAPKDGRFTVPQAPKRTRAKTGESDSHKSLESALSSVSDKVRKGTVYDGNTRFDIRKRDEMPAWLLQHQSNLLKKHGYDKYKKAVGHKQHIAALMNLCVCARSIGSKAATVANKILTDNSEIGMPLLKLKEKPIAPENNSEASFQSKRNHKYRNNMNRDDFPDLIERLLLLLDDFVERQNVLKAGEQFDWIKVTTAIRDYAAADHDTSKLSSGKITGIANTLLKMYPQEDFMQTNFEFHDQVNQWIEGTIDWNRVKMATENSLSFSDSDQLDNPEAKLRALLCQIYVNRVFGRA